ncbi:MAG: hypothetical protein HFJ46_04305 [Clostridia bacterium]|nr:hypothetical protein [Clostridia bacterium]
MDYEKEIKEWQELLESGQINEKTFKKEVGKLNFKKKMEAEKAINKEKKLRIKSEKDTKLSPDEKHNLLIKKIKIILTIIALILMLSYIPFNIRKAYSHPLSKQNLPAPIQKEASGSRTDNLNSVSMKIDYLYTYSISGRVVSTYHYVSDSIYDRISPIDVGISWGVLSMNKNNSQITFSHEGDRFLNYEITGDFSQILKNDSTYIDTHSSNNHLIPKSRDVLNKMKKIKKDDFIKIDGFLVNVTASYKNSFLRLESSISRDDTGDSACEVIFVSDITWL